MPQGAIQKWDDTWEQNPLFCAVTTKFQDVGVDDTTTFESAVVGASGVLCWSPLPCYITGILDYGASYALQGNSVRYTVIYGQSNTGAGKIDCVVDPGDDPPDYTGYVIARLAVSVDGDFWTTVEDHLFNSGGAFSGSASFSRTVTIPGSITELRFVRLSAAFQHLKQSNVTEVFVSISDFRYAGHDGYTPPIENPPPDPPGSGGEDPGNSGGGTEPSEQATSAQECIL